MNRIRALLITVPMLAVVAVPIIPAQAGGRHDGSAAIVAGIIGLGVGVLAGGALAGQGPGYAQPQYGYAPAYASPPVYYAPPPRIVYAPPPVTYVQPGYYVQQRVYPAQPRYDQQPPYATRWESDDD
jgi:hypothetical protein